MKEEVSMYCFFILRRMLRLAAPWVSLSIVIITPALALVSCSHGGFCAQSDGSISCGISVYPIMPPLTASTAISLSIPYAQ